MENTQTHIAPGAKLNSLEYVNIGDININNTIHEGNEIGRDNTWTSMGSGNVMMHDGSDDDALFESWLHLDDCTVLEMPFYDYTGDDWLKSLFDDNSPGLQNDDSEAS